MGLLYSPNKGWDSKSYRASYHNDRCLYAHVEHVFCDIDSNVRKKSRERIHLCRDKNREA